MYQVKFENGYEIQVTGDACRVVSRDYKIVHTGNYEECERWLNARAVQEIGKRARQEKAAKE